MDIQEQFLAPRCTIKTLDTFFVRHNILQALKEVLPQLSGTLLDVGSGYQPYRSLVTAPPSRVHTYVGLDLRWNLYRRPDLEWDGHIIPLQDNVIDCALATEVFEHSPEPETTMREIQRVLRPGGLLFFTVPFLWPLHTVPYDEYRYTPFALERHLHNAGFEQMTLKAMGGWDQSMAQMLGLWAKRRWSYSGQACSQSQRSLASRLQRAFWWRVLPRLAVPLARFLARIDTPPLEFKERTMMPGITGMAYKGS
jgi:SAM-dependent methyltransferase